MADTHTGGADTQTGSQGGDQTQTDANQQNNPQAQQPDTSGIFQKGYNEAKDKYFTRGQAEILSKIKEASGGKFGDLDSVVSFIKSKPVTNVTESDAYKDLQGKFNTLASERDDFKSQYEDLIQQNQLNRSFDDAERRMNEEKYSLTMPRNHFQTIFWSEFQINKNSSGQDVAFRNGIPQLNDKGDPKPLSDVMYEFAQQNHYIRQEGEGGDGQTRFGGEGKPSRKAFDDAVQAGDNDTAAKLYTEANEKGGWAK